MYAIIGLGNPGPRYANTRHNVGFWVTDAIAEKLAKASWQQFEKSSYIKLSAWGEGLLLIKPQSYMNCSGQAARSLLAYYKVSPAETIVIHDDMDLSVGQLRLKCGGASGGHKGIDDMTRSLGSDDFYRVRVGIGHPRDAGSGKNGLEKQGVMDVSDWVLSTPRPEEKELLNQCVFDCVQAVEVLIRQGLSEAQNRFNKRGASSVKAQ